MMGEIRNTISFANKQPIRSNLNSPQASSVGQNSELNKDAFEKNANKELSTPEKSDFVELVKNNAPLIAASSFAVVGAITSGVLLAKHGKLNGILYDSKDSITKLQAENSDISNKLAQANGAKSIDAQLIAKLQKDQQDLFQKMLFPSGINKIEFQQGNVGDCYAMSSLYALSRNKKGREVISKMISMDDKGDFLVKSNGLGKFSHETIANQKNLNDTVKGIFDSCAKNQDDFIVTLLGPVKKNDSDVFVDLGLGKRFTKAMRMQ